MPADTLRADLAALLGLTVAEAAQLAIEPCTTGGNNRVFVVTLPQRKLVAKHYFSDPGDSRDRLRAEYDFLTFAMEAGVSIVPAPVARDAARNVGLYEYVEGRRVTVSDVDAALVGQAAEFFLNLNAARHRGAAAALGPASEACFSVGEHFAMVGGRVARLESLPGESAVDRHARAFAADLAKRWGSLRSSIERRLIAAGESLATPVPDRCISPSDFGFHNALLGDDDRVRFIDFEYAGWDDPAKMAADFFTHPGVPVDARWFEAFVATTMSYSAAAETLVRRAWLLMPIFQLKWCCIMLNEFLPDSARRRRFANPQPEATARKELQLEKAVALFRNIRD